MPPEKAKWWFNQMRQVVEGKKKAPEKTFVPKVKEDEPFVPKEAMLKRKAPGGTWVSRTAEALEEKEAEANERDLSEGEKGKE